MFKSKKSQIVIQLKNTYIHQDNIEAQTDKFMHTLVTYLRHPLENLLNITSIYFSQEKYIRKSISRILFFQDRFSKINVPKK